MLRAPLLLGALAVLIAACGSPLRMDGAQVNEQYGRLVVDDVALEFSREVPLQGTLSEDARTAGLTLGAHTGNIELVGGPAETYEFVVTLQSEFEDDGVVEIVDGMLSVRSQRGGKCVINGVRGRLPQSTALDVLSGTGDVALSRFDGAGLLRVECGVGKLRLHTVQAQELVLHSGTGSVELEGVKSPEVRVDLGVGPLLSTSCEFGSLKAQSGTGDFVLRSSRVQRGRFRSGTGNLHLNSSHVGHLERSLGTGSVLEDKPD